MTQYLLSRGHSLKSKGHIGYSQKKKNSVVSNVWGAAAFNGRLDLLRSLYDLHRAETDFELKAEEKRGIATTGTFQKEVSGATPLMLAIIAGDQNLETVKWLIEEVECKTNVTDWQDNTILHLAVRYNCSSTVSYLICTNIVDPFKRNAEGESAVSMAQAMNLEEITQILAICKDNSGQKVCGIF